jgi:hypothetical protein
MIEYSNNLELFLLCIKPISGIFFFFASKTKKSGSLKYNKIKTDGLNLNFVKSWKLIDAKFVNKPPLFGEFKLRTNDEYLLDVMLLEYNPEVDENKNCSLFFTISKNNGSNFLMEKLRFLKFKKQPLL